MIQKCHVLQAFNNNLKNRAKSQYADRSRYQRATRGGLPPPAALGLCPVYQRALNFVQCTKLWVNRKWWRPCRLEPSVVLYRLNLREYIDTYIFAPQPQQQAVGAQQAAFNQQPVQVMALHQTGKTVAAEERPSFSTALERQQYLTACSVPIF